MKAAHLYLGTGGDLSKIQCLGIDRISGGFTITRDVNELHNIFNDLVQEDGTVMKQKDDYDRRAGQTAKPISTNPVLPVQVLHALLRTFDHYMKCVVHVKAGIFDWSESQYSQNKQFLKVAKSQLQEVIKSETGIKWYYPDATEFQDVFTQFELKLCDDSYT